MPTFVSAATSQDGTKVVLTYNEALSATTAAATAFTVTSGLQGNDVNPVSAVSISGSTVELTVTNNIKTVQAIAMCNMAELSGGLLTEVSLPDNTRWLPSGMSVQYLKKAKTDLVAVADGRDINWEEEGDKIVPVEIKDINDEVVFTAQINMNVKKL